MLNIPQETVARDSILVGKAELLLMFGFAILFVISCHA